MIAASRCRGVHGCLVVVVVIDVKISAQHVILSLRRPRMIGGVVLRPDEAL